MGPLLGDSLTSMIRRLFRFALKLGVVGSAVALAAKALDRRRSATPATDWSAGREPWPPVDVPRDTTTAPPSPAAGEGDRGDHAVWSEPDEDGSCPASHPVKAKLTSGVFHLPGMANYERTKADRCYPDADAAQADDLRQAKR